MGLLKMQQNSMFEYNDNKQCLLEEGAFKPRLAYK